MTFYLLESNNYNVVKASNILTTIRSQTLMEYVNRGMTESPLLIKKDFLKVI